MELPDTIATFDSKVGIFSRVEQPVVLASVCSYRNPKVTYMVIASVCSFCAIALMSRTRLEAMSRQEGELCQELKVVVSGCVVEWCVVSDVKGSRRMIQEAHWK